MACMQMGENELEWVSVTFGNMNVLNSAFIFCVDMVLQHEILAVVDTCSHRVIHVFQTTYL